MLQNPVLGIINEEIKQAIEKYPTRFAGTIQVDPIKESAVQIIKQYASEKQNTLKLEISEEWGWSGNYSDFSLLGHEMMLIWETVAELGLNVIIDTGDIFNNGYQVENIRRIAQRYPNTKILLEHLGFYRENTINDKAALARRIKLLSLAKDFDNVFLGFSSTASFLNDDYPCYRAVVLLKKAIDLVGANKILWGSDMPSTFKKYTYQQMIDVVDKHSKSLTATHKKLIFYKNSNDFFFS